MLGKLIYRVVGPNRFKNRGDRFFLENDFARALREYRRARWAVSLSDYRTATLDALIRECSTRLGESDPTSEIDTSDDEPPGPWTPSEEASFTPGLRDLFDLAIGEKSSAVSFVLQLELGRALSMAGEMEKARVELEKAYRLNPDDRESLLLLAAVDIQLRRFDEASNILETLVQKEDVGPETLFLLGRCLVGLGKIEQAMARFRETVEMDSRFHEAYFEGAKILKEHGDFEGALRLCTRASALVPDEVAYNLELAGLVLEHELDEQLGLEACDRLMVTDEENQWQYLSWIAELYVRRGWQREARDPLRKALRLVPPHRTEERLTLERRLAELEGQTPPSGR
jgi:tetratricopeptide (TPR) repeat protein